MEKKYTSIKQDIEAMIVGVMAMMAFAYIVVVGGIKLTDILLSLKEHKNDSASHLLNTTPFILSPHVNPETTPIPPELATPAPHPQISTPEKTRIQTLMNPTSTPEPQSAPSNNEAPVSGFKTIMTDSRGVKYKVSVNFFNNGIKKIYVNVPSGGTTSSILTGLSSIIKPDDIIIVKLSDPSSKNGYRTLHEAGTYEKVLEDINESNIGGVIDVGQSFIIIDEGKQGYRSPHQGNIFTFGKKFPRVTRREPSNRKLWDRARGSNKRGRMRV